MTHIVEIWQIVLHHLHDDAHASVRLMMAVPGLFPTSNVYWIRLEASLQHRHYYSLFCKLNKHLGVARRVVSWAAFCDGRCNACLLDMHGECTATFPLRTKLCPACRHRLLVCEWALPWAVPHARYCWLHVDGGRKARFFLRSEVLEAFDAQWR